MKLLINAKLIRPKKCNVWNLLFCNGKAKVPLKNENHLHLWTRIICITVSVV